ncbi:hypothetical protein BN997_01092 [Oceanobacillus oncorhynchi]|uniref:Phage protein n=1 Tax=Oceanobacillus oncorhynchi TaxID=545501 RepID=A0A0A1MNA9_9BACI|nr:hypothetical protein [Oceanobacillus oncorhynchi]CEI81274.1 hypothetical protein BN997_01092 [Oceanobacillus oncorhynchi]
MDERLEEIKNKYKNVQRHFSLFNIELTDFEYLIQQAEKVEGLESDIKANKKSVDWLLYQNQRYKEVLENALYFVKYSRHEPDKAMIMQQQLEKTLKGESE